MAQAEERTQALRVVTLNVHMGKEFAKNRSKYEEFLNTNPSAVGFDVLAMQEVCGPDQAALTDKIAGLVKPLGRPLFKIFISSDLHAKGACAKGQAILSRYPILSSGHTLLPKVREKRMLLWIDLRIDGRLVRVYDAHFDSRSTWIIDSAKGRAKQAQFVLDHSSEFRRNHPGAAVIVMGDLNTWYHEKGLDILARELEPSLAFWKNRKTTTFAEADWIFFSGLRLLDSKVIKAKKLSDHLPVMADFEVLSQ